MSKFMNELISTLKNNPSHTYDFIAQHGHEASEEEQRQIILELVYVLSVLRIDQETIFGNIAEDLREMYEEE